MAHADEPSLDELSELVLQCLDRIERSGPGAVEEVCREHPEHAEALRLRMRTLVGTGLLEVDAELPERLGDFRLLHRLGAGGMGVVFAAVQESLGREVALKVVRPDQLLFPDARERFRREVEVVARLQHPGIVPVYTVGEERGIPFFAMELQRGATLAEMLAEFRGRAPRSGSELAEALADIVERRGEPRPEVTGALFEHDWIDACLIIVRQVALALDFAHRNDVLHRDLKPSNLMLTVDGRALLFDFGLASARDAARVTRTGSQVGSLAYMAPEQLRGEALDVRTDVYGLGATLCELLTLTPPHGELSGEVLVRAILSSEPVELRAANPAISRDLDTVCRKTLEGDPSRRYPDAARLARDLEHLLARRPVEARRVGPLRRGLRWVQRHPARAVALALAVGAPAVFAVQASLASARIAEQRDRAEANLEQALRALEVFLWEVGSDALEGIPRMEATRYRLLEEALVLFEELMPQQADEPALRLRWADLQRSMGEVLAMLDRLGEAEACFVNQLSVLQELEAPDAEQADQLVGCLNNLGNVLLEQGRPDEAIAAYERARDLLGAPTDPRGLDQLSTLQRNLGHALEGRGRLELADQAFAGAVLAAERLVAAGGDVAAARSQLGSALLAAAILEHRSGDSLSARASLGRALPILIERAEASPGEPGALHDAAIACLNAGALEERPDAEPLLRDGLALAERLVDDFPATPAYARTLSSLCQSLALTQRALGRWEEVEPGLVRGLAVIEGLAERGPDVLENQLVLGEAGANLASWWVERERRSEAIGPAQTAVRAFTRALELRPEDAAIRGRLAWARIQEAYGRASLGQLAATEALIGPLAELAPEDPGVFVATAELLSLCAGLDADRADDFETRSLDALERGLQLGFADFAYLRRSVELSAVASSARFAELLAQAELAHGN